MDVLDIYYSHSTYEFCNSPTDWYYARKAQVAETEIGWRVSFVTPRHRPSRLNHLQFNAFANILEVATLGCNSQSNNLYDMLATLQLHGELVSARQQCNFWGMRRELEER